MALEGIQGIYQVGIFPPYPWVNQFVANQNMKFTIEIAGTVYIYCALSAIFPVWLCVYTTNIVWNLSSYGFLGYKYTSLTMDRATSSIIHALLSML